MQQGRVPLQDDVLPLMLRKNPNYKYKDFEETQRDNDVRVKLANQQNMRPYELNCELYGVKGHDGIAGTGYINPPNSGGYLFPPNKTVKGGFLPILSALAPMIPMAIDIIGNLISRKGKGISPSEVYQKMDDIVKQHKPEVHGRYQKEMHKMFGSKVHYDKMMNGVTGSGITKDMKVGDLVIPPLMGQFKKNHINKRNYIKLIQMHSDKLNEPANTLLQGSGIWSSILNVIKSIISNPSVQEVGKDLAKKGLNKVVDIASDKIKEKMNPQPIKVGNGKSIRRNEVKSGGWVVRLDK